MNDMDRSNRLAMARVDRAEAIEGNIERAVEDALTQRCSVCGRPTNECECAPGGLVVVEDGRRDAEARVKAMAEAEAQRQRDLDAAMTDTVTIVDRMRHRLGRRGWSTSDGATVNKIYALLKAMNGAVADIDSGFGS